MKTATLYSDNYDYLRRRRQREAVQRAKQMESNSMVMVYTRIFWIIGILCASLAIASIAACIFTRQFYMATINQKDAEIAELTSENEELMAQISSYSDTYDETVSILANVSEIAYELDEENNQLVSQSNELQDQIDQFAEREELFDKYEWAILRSDDSRTDITYDRLTSLEELADERNLSEDTTNLVLALTMAESQGTEDAANSESTARGFGQLLQGTAKFVYEDLMENGKGSYNHDMAFDGDTNFDMMVYYLDYLGVKYSDNIDLVLKEYRGGIDDGHSKKLNKYLTKAGTNLHSIELHP